MSQVVLDVRELQKSYAGRVLLDGVSFSVASGEKVGVIGRNGSGKTTLFRVLAGAEGIEGGVVSRKKNLVVSYLPQDPDLDPSQSALEAASEGRPAATATGAAGWESAHQVERTLTHLGISDWDRKMAELSEGERRRVALARALLSEPELLLLDEPTNHLDADTVLWLEETLFDLPGAVMVVTHDRYFLDRVVDRMLELVNGSIKAYEGGYTEYLEVRADRLAREEAEEAKRARFLNQELAWARRSPPARTGKQKARRRRASELADESEDHARRRPQSVTLQFQHSPRMGRRILDIEGLGFRYGDRVLIEGFSDRLRAGERIGVVGPNGAGKTTLLKLLVGVEQPSDGRIVVGENTRIGYLDQERAIDPTLSVERVVSDGDWVRLDGRSVHVRAYLDRFLFPAHLLHQKVGSLSGGEKSRLLLARLLLEEFNLLILDEPTNDLDLDTLRILEDALESFSGCVVVVTHDRYLLDKLATALWIFEGEGVVHRHEGSWDTYLARREERRRTEQSEAMQEERAFKKARAAAYRWARAAGSDAKRLSYNERRELEGIPARIAGLEAERDGLSGLLADPELYREEAARVSEVTVRYAELEKELEALYERWLELEERA